MTLVSRRISCDLIHRMYYIRACIVALFVINNSRNVDDTGGYGRNNGHTSSNTPSTNDPPVLTRVSLNCTFTVNQYTVTISSALQEIYPFFLEITKRDDCLPKNICFECVNNLKTSYRFRKICEVNNKKILKILTEHNLENGNVQESYHYKYNIKNCRYFRQSLIKNEDVCVVSDSHSTEQAGTDFKEEISEIVKKESVQAKSENEIQDGYKNKESRSLENKFKCVNCPKTFLSRSGFCHHKLTHEATYQCDICNKKFPIQHNLNLHKRRHASNSHFTHLCPECGRKFLTSSELVRHRRTHADSKLYDCNICSKKFSQSYSLKLHKMQHVGYKPNICEVCGKRFIGLGKLNNHKLTHMAEKPHSCKICERTWVTSSDLKKHMRTHSGEKPYDCQYCEKNFARKETLKVHERTHTGEKPYNCDKCSKVFVHLSSLHRHVTYHCIEVQKVDPLNT